MSAISASCCRARSGCVGGSGVSLRQSLSGCVSSPPARSSPVSGFASSSSSSSHQATFFHRSSSPTHVDLVRSSSPPASSVRFPSPGRSFSAASLRDAHNAGHRKQQIMKRPIGGGSAAGTVEQKRTCACSPSKHPGSFRCALHRASAIGGGHVASSSRLNARRSAMTNSLVRIGTVEGEWVRRALAALIRPSSHQQRRRAAFQPRPSRLSVVSKADDLR